MKFSFEIARSNGAKMKNTGRQWRSSRVMPEHSKVIQNINRSALRMYDAAISNNLNADFPVSWTSANAEIQTSLVNTRSRSRTLERDDSYAVAILEAYRNNVGGDEPFRYEPGIGVWKDGQFVENRDENRILKEWWREVGKKENFCVNRTTSRLEAYLQAIVATIRDGGIIGRKYRGYDNKFGYALDLIEIDRLDSSYNTELKNGTQVQFSIKLDEYNAPIGYWILTRHPGDVFAFSNSTRYRELVDAKDVIALFDLRTRAGQLVGMSRLASIIQHLHRVKQFDVAHLTAAIWSACKPIFLEKDWPSAMEAIPDSIRTQMQDMANGGGDGSNEGEKFNAVSPGEVEELPFGTKVKQIDPKFPIEAASGFKKDNLKAAAAGSGVPYFLVAQDLADVNFSSGRLGFGEFQTTAKILQKHIIESFVVPDFETRIEYAILSGNLPFSISRLEELKKSARFLGRRWPYMQPLQDAQADSLKLQMGLTSRDDLIAESERGGDTEEVNGKIAADNASDESHGLDFSHVYNPNQPAESEPESEPAVKSRLNGNGHIQV